jgi:hypothetical protein
MLVESSREMNLSPSPIIIKNNNISTNKAIIIFFLSVIMTAIILFSLGYFIAHSIGSVETRYDHKTLKYKY